MEDAGGLFGFDGRRSRDAAGVAPSLEEGIERGGSGRKRSVFAGNGRRS
jgi:hypothetical protein